MKAIILILTISFISCSKQPENIEVKKHCEWVVMLSDKYLLLDTTFLRTDTLSWNGGNEMKRQLCDSTLEVFKRNANDTEFKICGTNLLEKRRFIYLP